MAASLVTSYSLLLFLMFAVCEGKCTVAVFQDIPGSDIQHFPTGKTPRDCAVACRDDRNCIAFVTSPSNDCWTKYALGTQIAVANRAVFYTEGSDCTALFTE